MKVSSAGFEKKKFVFFEKLGFSIFDIFYYDKPSQYFRVVYRLVEQSSLYRTIIGVKFLESVSMFDCPMDSLLIFIMFTSQVVRAQCDLFLKV